MRHYKKGRKLGTDASHTAAIKKNLMVNLFTNDRIKTNLERAKEVRGDVDRIITWAKRGDVHARRLAVARLGDKDLVAEIFAKVEQGLFKDRPGGYTRIYKVGKRRGDDAVIVLMELVQEPVKFKNKAASTDDAAEKGGLKVEKKPRKAKKATDGADAAKAADAVEDEKAEDTAEPENAEAVEAPAEDETPAEEEAKSEEAAKTEDAAAEDAADAAKAEDAVEAPAEDAKAEDAKDAPAEEEAKPEDATSEDKTPEEEAPADENDAPAEDAKDAPADDEAPADDGEAPAEETPAEDESSK
jgi:large subunit ribosomal protein L17